MDTLLHEILKAAGIPYTSHYALEVYLSEPKYTTLLGLKRMLQHYGIVTKAVRTDSDHLKETAYPYVLHQKNDFKVIQKAEDLKDDVLKQWDGILLYISDKSQAVEPEYRKHRMQWLVSRAIYGFLLLIPVAAAALSGSHYVFSLLGLIGLILGVLLLQKQLGESSKVGDGICHLFQKHGCDAVLSTKKAKIGGTLSLSEVGLGYFWAQLLLTGLSSSLYPSVQLIAVIGMIFPVWSIYSQWRMKLWCGLCLFTQAILILQGIWVLFTGIDVQLTLQAVVPFCLSGGILLAGILGAHLVAQEITQHQEADKANWYMRHTMRYPAVFQALMAQSELHEYQPSDVVETLGNPEAEHRVAVYLSRTCKYCIALQPELETFIRTQGHKFLIEKISTDDLTDEQQEEFAKRTGLTGTPTILLDGYTLPNQCKINDLGYVL